MIEVLHLIDLTKSKHMEKNITIMKKIKELIKLEIFWSYYHTLTPTDPKPPTSPIPYLRSRPKA